MPNSEQKDNPLIRRARRTAAAAALITIVLSAAKASVGYASSSSALMADAVHSISDTIVLGATWFGLRMASRPANSKFPYGYYRAETIAALAVSVIIMGLGGWLIWEGYQRLWVEPDIKYAPLAIIMTIVTIVDAIIIAIWQKRVAKATNSQSLAASADEVTMDAIASFIVAAAVICSIYHVHYVEGIITILIAFVVIVVGIKNVRSSVLSLMDASVDPELEETVKAKLQKIPGVRRLEKLHARRAGPFFFLEGHLHVMPSMDVARSHTLVHEAERQIKEEQAHVESLILHVEPYRPDRKRLLVPVESENGCNSGVTGHFASSPFFLVATVEKDAILKEECLPNDLSETGSSIGLEAITGFVKEQKIDAAIVREIGEISFHAILDNFVEVYQAPECDAKNAIDSYIKKELKPLTGATHHATEIIGNGKSKAKSP